MTKPAAMRVVRVFVLGCRYGHVCFVATGPAIRLFRTLRRKIAQLSQAVRLFGCWMFDCPTPFSQRLRTQQTPAVWLPQDSQTSCSDLRHLSERRASARSEL